MSTRTMATSSFSSYSFTNPYFLQKSTSFSHQLQASIGVLYSNFIWLTVLLILMISSGERATFSCSFSSPSSLCSSFSCLFCWYLRVLLIFWSRAVRSLNCLYTSSYSSSLRLQYGLRRRVSSCGRWARVESLDMKAGMRRFLWVWQMFLQLLSKVEYIFFLLKWSASVQLMFLFFMRAMLGSAQLQLLSKKEQLRVEYTISRMLLRLSECVMACSLSSICSWYLPSCSEILQKQMMQLLIDSSSVLFWLILSPSEIDCRHSSRQCIFRLMKAVDRMQWLILLLIKLTSDFSWNRFPSDLSKQRCISLAASIAAPPPALSSDLRQLVLKVWSCSASSSTCCASAQGFAGAQFSRLNLTSSIDLVSMKSCCGTRTSSPLAQRVKRSWMSMISLKSSFQKQMYILRTRKSIRFPCSSLLLRTLRSVLSIFDSSRQKSLKLPTRIKHCLYFSTNSMLAVTESSSASKASLLRHTFAASVRVSILRMRNWTISLCGSFSSPSTVLSWRQKRMEMTCGLKKLPQFILFKQFKSTLTNYHTMHITILIDHSCTSACSATEALALPRPTPALHTPRSTSSPFRNQGSVRTGFCKKPKRRSPPQESCIFGQAGNYFSLTHCQTTLPIPFLLPFVLGEAVLASILTFTTIFQRQICCLGERYIFTQIICFSLNGWIFCFCAKWVWPSFCYFSCSVRTEWIGGING